MKTTLVKARKFYFEKFLPSVLSCMLITLDNSNTWEFSLMSASTKLEHAKPDKYVPVTNVKSKMTTTCTPSAISKEMTSLPKAASGHYTTSTKIVTPKTLSSRNVTTVGSKTMPTAMTTVSVTTLSLDTFVQTTKMTPAGPKLVATADIEITSSHMEKSLTLDQLLQELKCKCHYIKNGDGSCFYHTVAHQAGLIDKTSKGNIFISGQLRQLVVNMMTKHPGIGEVDGLSLVQWFQKMVLVPNPHHGVVI